jgi:hypothetical protein
MPALVVEFSQLSVDGSGVKLALPPNTRLALTLPAAGAQVFHAWIDIGGATCSVWFIGLQGGDPDVARRLRVHIARFHAERECLRIMLAHIGNPSRLPLDGPGTDSEAVQEYLNDSLRSIQRPARFGIPQAQLLEATLSAFEEAIEGQDASLLHMRRQVAVKVEAYLRKARSRAIIINKWGDNAVVTTITLKNSTIQGDFTSVTAHTIQDSFNKAAASSSPLKVPLQDLSEEVTKLASELPKDQAEAAARDLASLTSEALSPSPRKKAYEVSAEGLIEAAETVATMTGPITKAVKAVLALLT